MIPEVFTKALTDFRDAICSGQDAQIFAAHGKVLSELSVVSDEALIRRVKHLLLMARSTGFDSAEFLRLFSLAEPIQITEIEAVQPTGPLDSVRVTFHELLVGATTRVCMLRDPILLGELRVVGGKIAVSPKFETKVLMSLIVETNNSRHVRTIRKFTADEQRQIVAALQEELGQLTLKL